MTLSALYVPGDRPERFAKAAASGADVVVVDLEDAVAPDHKEAARAAAAAWLADGPPVRVEVRVNAAGTPWHDADLAALSSAALSSAAQSSAALSSAALSSAALSSAAPSSAALPATGVIRLPKVTGTEVVDAAAAQVSADTTFACLVEDAVGLLALPQIAAHPRVSAVALGEADLSSALGVDSDAGLGFARGLVVAASRAAGLGAPMASVFADVRDLEGLAASTRRLASFGFVGRMAVHPTQVPVIRAAFRPPAERVVAAQELLAAVAYAGITEGGVLLLPDGRMVDPAMLGRARELVALADATA